MTTDNQTQQTVCAGDSRTGRLRARTVSDGWVIERVRSRAEAAGRPVCHCAHGGGVPSAYDYPTETEAIVAVGFPDGAVVWWAAQLSAKLVTLGGAAGACCGAGDVWDGRTGPVLTDIAKARLYAAALRELGRPDPTVGVEADLGVIDRLYRARLITKSARDVVRAWAATAGLALVRGERPPRRPVGLRALVEAAPAVMARRSEIRDSPPPWPANYWPEKPIRAIGEGLARWAAQQHHARVAALRAELAPLESVLTAPVRAKAREQARLQRLRVATVEAVSLPPWEQWTDEATASELADVLRACRAGLAPAMLGVPTVGLRQSWLSALKWALALTHRGAVGWRRMAALWRLGFGALVAGDPLPAGDDAKALETAPLAVLREAEARP